MYYKIVTICFIGLASVLISGCDEYDNRSTQIQSINFDASRKPQNYQLKDIAKNIEYIELESSSESFIGEISQILYNENHILVLDKKLQEIFLFSSKGKFIRKIGRRGNGPGEYGTVFSVDLTPDGLIYLHSTGNKILEYNISGDFTRSIPLKKIKLQYFKVIGERVVFAIPYPLTEVCGGYSLGVMDKTGNIKNKFLFRNQPNNGKPQGIVCNTGFYTRSDSICFWEYIYDTIYCITPKGFLAPKWVINYGSNAIPRDAFRDIGTLNSAKHSGMFLVSHLLESKEHMFFIALQHRRRQLYILKKRNGEILTISPKEKHFFGLSNNFDFGPSFWPQNNVNDSTIACVLNPEKLILMSQDEQLLSKIKNDDLFQILKLINVKSNPVLMKVTTK
ncbi:MAG: 6-bladed beta-propeller [Bacteroidota bacterium]|nr:6-bladed beta-propeller [Bacteroidota bacterium]